MVRGLPEVEAKLVVQVDTPVLVFTAAAVQPVIGVEPFEKLTVPPSGAGLTVAVKVTGVPTVTELAEVLSTVEVEALEAIMTPTELVWPTAQQCVVSAQATRAPGASLNIEPGNAALVFQVCPASVLSTTKAFGPEVESKAAQPKQVVVVLRHVKVPKVTLERPSLRVEALQRLVPKLLL